MFVSIYVDRSSHPFVSFIEHNLVQVEVEMMIPTPVNVHI